MFLLDLRSKIKAVKALRVAEQSKQSRVQGDGVLLIPKSCMTLKYR